MRYVLKNKETGEVIDPRTDDFALSPSDLGDFESWDDALGQHSEADLIEGFEVIVTEKPTTEANAGNRDGEMDHNKWRGFLVGEGDSYIFSADGEIKTIYPD